MTAEQIKLLNTANRALGQQPVDLETARGAVEKALAMGDRFDLLLLTYGRVLQKSDECAEARAVFNEMNFAPHEPSVALKDLKRLRTKYVGQMSTLCSAVLTVTCTNPETSLALAGQGLTCGDSVKLVAGAYQVEATVGRTSKVYDIELRGAEERTYNVALSDTAVAEPEEPEVPEDEGFRYVGTVAAGVTTVALTAVATGVWAYTSGQQDAVLEGKLDSEGFWRDEVSVEDRATLEAEANDWGQGEVASGVAIPVVAGIGLVTTAIFFMLESGEESAPEVSVGVDPTRGEAFGEVRWRW